MKLRRPVWLAIAAMTVAGLQVLAVPVGAFAHGLTARADLPIPAWLFAWAATLVLLVSFAALAVLWRKPLLASCKERELIPFGVGVDLLLGTVGIACFVLVCWAGLVGTFVPTANLAPTAIWVLFWVGVPVASACFGDIFRLLSPWRSTARLVGWLIGQLVPEGLPAPRRWPERLGRLPAVAGLLAMGWLELAYSGRDDPHTLAVLALLYAAVQLVGMSFWGVETWSDRGDSFGVLFSLISKIAPLGRVDGRLQLRVPLSGLARLTEIRWTQLLLLVVIGTTTFDGFTQGPLWADFSVWLRDRFSDGGLAMTAAGEAASTIGLFAAILVVSGIWLAGVRGAATRLGSDPLLVGRRFEQVLVPIALAYTVAHYASFLVIQGQAVGYLISDPLGNGSDWFGTAYASIDYGLLGPTAVWWVQVAVLVLGHIAALMLAHDRALELADDPRTATRSQVPMLVATVAFTVLGLWLLSAANL